MKTEQILDLNRLIHAPNRLAILSLLVSVESASFTFLRESLGITDGNLNTHLGKLEAAGLIKIKKSFRGKNRLPNAP